MNDTDHCILHIHWRSSFKIYWRESMMETSYGGKSDQTNNWNPQPTDSVPPEKGKAHYSRTQNNHCPLNIALTKHWTT